MPGKGFTSITVRNKYYTKIRLDYQRNKKSLQLVGITTFAQYVESLSEKRKISDIDDLKEILCIQTQVLITMFDFMLGCNKEMCQDQQIRNKIHMQQYLKSFQEQ